MIDPDLEVLFWLGKDPQELIHDSLSPELVFDPMVKEIYTYALGYYQEYQEFPNKDVLEHEFLAYNLTFEDPVTHLDDLAERLKNRYVEKQAEQSIYSVGKHILQNPREVASKMIEEGRRLDSILSTRKDVFDSDMIDKAILSYHKRVARGLGPSFGFDEIDDYFHGMEALTYLIAIPGGLKSWTGTKSKIENIRKGKRVYWAGLEMPTETYEWRLLCMAANIPFWKYQHGKLEPEDITKIKKESVKLNDLGDYLIDKPSDRSVHSIYTRARNFGADVIYIDQLQYVFNRKGIALGATNKTEEFFQVCNDLRDISDELPIFCLHQFNRSLLGTSDFPEMQQVKSSAAIEETATLALGLFSTKAMRQDNIVQIGSLKNRNEAQAIWELEVQMRKGCSINLIERVDL